MKPLQDNVVANVTFREASDSDPEARSELQEDADDINFSILQLQSGQRYALRKENRKYQGWLEVLAESPPGEPLYIETEPGTQTVKSILVPLPRRVKYISAEPKEGRLRVNLHLSPRVFYLSQELTGEKFGRFRELLERSQASDEKVLVTTRPATGEILDVRDLPEELKQEGSQKEEPPGREENGADEDDDENGLELVNLQAGVPQGQGVKFSVVSFAVTSALTMAQAIAQFDNMASQSHIPFHFVRDCCTGRAHEMCRIMGDDGVRTRKVWNYGSGWTEPDQPPTLHVQTNSVPEGFVDWRYHVAPTVGVRSNNGTTRRMVIDPSLFDEPVPISIWVDRQSDPNSETRRKASNLIWFDYLTGEQFPDPDNSETDRQLRAHRAAANDEFNS